MNKTILTILSCIPLANLFALYKVKHLRKGLVVLFSINIPIRLIMYVQTVRLRDLSANGLLTESHIEAADNLDTALLIIGLVVPAIIFVTWVRRNHFDAME